MMDLVTAKSIMKWTKLSFKLLSLQEWEKLGIPRSAPVVIRLTLFFLLFCPTTNTFTLHTF